MAVIVDQLFDGETLTRGQNPSASVPFLVFGTGDPVVAENELVAQSPATYDGLTKTDATVEPLTLNAWRGTVLYGTLPPEGATVISFDTTGGTRHITHSLQTIARYPAPGLTAPNHKGAIGVTKDSVEGVEVPAPKFDFSIIKTFAPGALTLAYALFLRDMTGRVNGDIWNGFAKGEVMFMGAQAQGSYTDRLIPVSFNFNGEANATNIPIGGSGIVVAQKEGWHYLWVEFAEDVDATANALIKIPIAAHVERVAEYADFSTLGV